MQDDTMQRFKLLKKNTFQFRRGELNELRLKGIPGLCMDLLASYETLTSRFEPPRLLRAVCDVLIGNGTLIQSSCVMTSSRYTVQMLMPVHCSEPVETDRLVQFANHLILMMPRCTANRLLIVQLDRWCVESEPAAGQSLGYLCIKTALHALNLLLEGDCERAYRQIISLKSVCIWYESQASSDCRPPSS